MPLKRQPPEEDTRAGLGVALHCGAAPVSGPGRVPAPQWRGLGQGALDHSAVPIGGAQESQAFGRCISFMGRLHNIHPWADVSDRNYLISAMSRHMDPSHGFVGRSVGPSRASHKSMR